MIFKHFYYIQVIIIWLIALVIISLIFLQLFELVGLVLYVGFILLFILNYTEIKKFEQKLEKIVKRRKYHEEIEKKRRKH